MDFQKSYGQWLTCFGLLLIYYTVFWVSHYFHITLELLPLLLFTTVLLTIGVINSSKSAVYKKKRTGEMRFLISVILILLGFNLVFSYFYFFRNVFLLYVLIPNVLKSFNLYRIDVYRTSISIP